MQVYFGNCSRNATYVYAGQITCQGQKLVQIQDCRNTGGLQSLTRWFSLGEWGVKRRKV